MKSHTTGVKFLILVFALTLLTSYGDYLWEHRIRKPHNIVYNGNGEYGFVTDDGQVVTYGNTLSNMNSYTELTNRSMAEEALKAYLFREKIRQDRIKEIKRREYEEDNWKIIDER